MCKRVFDPAYARNIFFFLNVHIQNTYKRECFYSITILKWIFPNSHRNFLALKNELVPSQTLLAVQFVLHVIWSITGLSNCFLFFLLRFSCGFILVKLGEFLSLWFLFPNSPVIVVEIRKFFSFSHVRSRFWSTLISRLCSRVLRNISLCYSCCCTSNSYRSSGYKIALLWLTSI